MEINILGIEFAPAPMLQTLAMLYFYTLAMAMPFLSIFLSIYKLLFTKYWWTMVLYACWFYYDFHTPKRGSRPCEWFKRMSIWRYFRDYFQIQLVKMHDLDPNRNYIFASHPHGFLCTGALSAFCTEATDFSAKFPGIKAHFTTLVGNFWFPFRREYMMAQGMIEASAESIQWQLNRPEKGHAVVILVGGSAEAKVTYPGSYNLILAKRKGFVRMAMKCGADLVPVISFGENDICSRPKPDQDSRLGRFQLAFKSRFGFELPIIYGRGIFNFPIGLLPYRKPIYTLVGKPIHVEQCNDPNPDQIDDLHQRYIQCLTDFFEENKAMYSVAEDVHLNII